MLLPFLCLWLNNIFGSTFSSELESVATAIVAVAVRDVRFNNVESVLFGMLCIDRLHTFWIPSSLAGIFVLFSGWSSLNLCDKTSTVLQYVGLSQSLLE